MSLTASTCGTFAWFTYATRAYAYYHGVSIGSGTLQLGFLSEASLDNYLDYGLEKETVDNKDIYWVDGVVAILIATKILFEAIKIFMESYNVLMDVSMPQNELEKIKGIIANEKEIDHLDKITSKSVGNEFIVIVKISIDGNKTVNESHHIAGKLKSEIMKLKGVYDVIVHVNPA